MNNRFTPEQKDQMVDSGIRVASAALAVMWGTMVAQEKFTHITFDMREQQDLSQQIASLENQNTTLADAETMLDEAGITVNGMEGVIEARQQQIAELQAQKDHLGNEAVNNLEFMALPLILGGAVLAYGVRRTAKKVRALRNPMQYSS